VYKYVYIDRTAKYPITLINRDYMYEIGRECFPPTKFERLRIYGIAIPGV